MRASPTRRWRIWTLFSLALACVVCVGAAPLLAQSKETFEQTTNWMPRHFSTTGDGIDSMFDWIMAITSITGIGVFGFLIYFLIRYRHKPGRQAKFTHGNTKLEIAWTLIPTLILAGTAAVSQATWSRIKSIDKMPDPTKEEVVRVNVVGRQFAWYFWYPGKDGVFGNRSNALIQKGAQQPDQTIGLDRSGAGKDDVVETRMTVPVGKKVLINLTSIDVIHSFFVPSMGVKQDAVPGLVVPVWFEATKKSREVVGVDEVGNAKPFDIVCAELCGPQHYSMRGTLFVLSREEYEKYIGDLQEEAAASDGF